MTKPEILAPCGGFPALLAALRCGADAVYFGFGAFNARRNAANFSDEEAEKAFRLCRLHGVRAHITLNTLVSDDELKNLAETLKRTCREAADALILQDLGVIRLARTLCPDLPRHASTQMTVGTPAGLRLLASRGFSRAVLPRELAKTEIAELSENAPLELEAFVHGALCMCVSGQCLLSAMLGSRSGNRGLCAQPCRLPFAADGGTGHDLSLKDLSLIENLPELVSLGVCSFKIEGRMKRPEYVAAAVTACREALAGDYSDTREADLEALFSRSGFTDGYFENNRGKAMFGTRKKENVTAATNTLLKSYEKLYEKECAVRPVQFEFTAKINTAPRLVATCDGHSVTVFGDTLCEPAKTRPLTEETGEKQLQKCGGTVFFSQEIQCHTDENIALPLSELNALRRKALVALTEALSAPKPYKINDIPLLDAFPAHKAGTKKWYFRFRDASSVPENLQFDRLFLPLSTPKQTLAKHRAGVYLPRGLFGSQKQTLKALQESGATYALCDTLDAVAIAKEAGTEIIGGPFLNLFNTLALKEAEEIGISEATVSYELTVNQINRLGGELPRGVCVYGRTPLMLTRNCPIKNGMTCAQCGRKQSITDRKGIAFPVRCENGFSEIFNSRPTCLSDRLHELQNIDFYLLDFTTESKAECRQIIENYRHGAPADGAYTRGLYYRGVE